MSEQVLRWLRVRLILEDALCSDFSVIAGDEVSKAGAESGRLWQRLTQPERAEAYRACRMPLKELRRVVAEGMATVQS